MTIAEVIAVLQNDKREAVPSRSPCRAIMVKNIRQYCELLSELKKLGDIRVIEADELFRSVDVMPEYANLLAEQYRNEWVILTGVSEYLRMFSQREAKEKRFSGLWNRKNPASSHGRIIIPLWDCEAQWLDSGLGLTSDLRQDDFFYNCIDDDEPEQEMNLLVLSSMFEPHIKDYDVGTGTLIYGLKAWYSLWETPNVNTVSFVLVTRCYKYVTPVSGSINIHVVKDFLSFIQEAMPGGACLTEDNCTEEMRSELLDSALHGVSLDDSLLKILNVSSFSGIDIMSKWKQLSASHKNFVKLWFQLHPDNSYLRHCFRVAASVADVPSAIMHEIFRMRMIRPDWVSEFKKLNSIMEILPDAAYFEALDAIPEFEKRLDYINNNVRDERIYLLKMVGQWMRKDVEQANRSDKLKESYPALFAYLSHDLAALQGDIGTYLSRYKAHKLENTLPGDESLHFSGADVSSFDCRYAVLSEYEDDDTVFLWVDALGVEWLSLLHWALTNRCDGRITNVAITQATLPTETCFNEQWKEMGMPHLKLDKLDKLAHKGVIDEPNYYACIDEQMDFVIGILNQVSKLLEEHHRVVITGDHGTSRLAARFFHKREGMDVPKDAVVCSHGRYCKLPQNVTLSLPNVELVKCKGRDAQEERYAVCNNYDHFKQSGRAAGAEDDNPIFGEVHGGATPEELLVPVIVIEGKKEMKISASWEKQTVKIARRRAELAISFSKQIENLVVRIAGNSVDASRLDAGKTWAIVIPNAKAGTYTVEVRADGQVVSLADITLLSALGGGIGDLP